MTVTLPHPTPAQARRALAGVLLTVTLWGGNVVLLKALLVQGHLNAESINVGRFLIAGVVLVALSVRSHGWPRWEARTWVQVAAVGLLGNTLFQAFFLTGIRANPAGVAGLVNGIVPVLVVPLGLLLGQRASGRQVSGVGLALAGLLTLLAVTRQPGTAVTPGGFAWIIGAATVWALYTLWNRPLGERVGALPFVAFSLVLGCVPYVLWAVPHLGTHPDVPLWAWGGVALSALGANVIAYLGWANGARVLGAARTSVWNTLAPAVALGLSAALLHERLPPAVWLGAGIILVGAALANWPDTRAGRASAE